VNIWVSQMKILADDFICKPGQIWESPLGPWQLLPSVYDENEEGENINSAFEKLSFKPVYEPSP